MKKELTRQSNLELLRIVAMLFIVLWHVVIHVTKNSMEGGMYVKAVTCTGVNLFVMISGYFNIRLSSRSFLNMVGTVIFYSLSSLLVAVFVFDKPFSAVDIMMAFLPMSYPGVYWFVSCYLLLMLLSPAINMFLNKSSTVEYVGALVVIGYICCVSGWIFHNPINLHGSTAFNMIFIYMLGDGIRRFGIANKLKPYVWLILYGMFTVVLCGMWIFAEGRAGLYNNPVLIMSAFSLFAFFVGLRFNSRMVNNVAACMFPVYLIQDGFAGICVYKLLVNKSLYCNWGGCLGLLVSYVFALFILALVLEPLRKIVMDKPITWIARFVSAKISVAAKKLR